jgi:hypothetical protein
MKPATALRPRTQEEEEEEFNQKRKALFEAAFGKVSEGAHQVQYPRDLALCDIERVHELETALAELRGMVSGLEAKRQANTANAQEIESLSTYVVWISTMQIEISELHSNSKFFVFYF